MTSCASRSPRLATEIFLGDLKFIETELMPRLLSKIDEGNNLRTAFALSMIIDAVKLGAPTPQASASAQVAA